VRHSITRFRITLTAYRAILAPRRKFAGVWRTRAQLERLAFTAAHKKILAKLHG
jgi:adenine-specific DNA glycosylase